MSADKSSNFTASYTYKWAFTKDEIIHCPENQALWGSVQDFGEPYGPWMLSFYPNGYRSSVPAKFAFILKSSFSKDESVPSCLARAELTLTNYEDQKQSSTVRFSNRYHPISKINPCIGCGWYRKNFFEKFPDIQSWNKIDVTLVCFFTEIVNNVVDERNWITYKFLATNVVSYVSDYFFTLDLDKKKLEQQNVDCNVICYAKPMFSKQPKEISIPMHKSLLIKQSDLFAKYFEENSDVQISFPNFSEKVVKDIILFCYKNELDSYTDQHVVFAVKYEMKELLRKADEYLSTVTKKSNVRKMMQLTEKYNLPELTKQCFYISETNKGGSLKAFFTRFIQSIALFFERLFNGHKKF
uniref:BTB domain-containing protein n=1 Tax=Panagrolaimus superbus TaxID=310955 RepID=A0A914YFT6_9BILA